jgi:TetR/AcrR family transcriptional repressor of lmrAB and yxaGH operons
MKDRTQPDTRERLLRAGEQLFRTQGYAGTGLKQLTQTADAPWGSLYHFFPEGKAQLGAEVLHYAGQLYGAGWHGVFKRYPNPGEAIEKVFLAEITTLTRSDYRDGCPITSVTMDVASTSEALRAACADAFGGWLAQIETGLRAAGAPEDAAKALAGFVLSALEGAIVLSRAAKDPAALLQSARFVRQVIDREAATWTSKTSD